MPDLSHITIDDTTYDVKDAVARGKGACWFGTSDTGASTATKAVTCTGYTEVAGSILGVFFSTANTAATPTLSVNNGTERSIYIGGGAPNATSNVLKWSANTMLYFMWDGTYYLYIGATQSSSVASSEGATCWWGTSSTAATSRDKTASITNYKPTKGTLVAIRFSTANTYASNSLRLNINSTNVKTVYNNAGATSASNPLPWEANDTLLFMYDGSYYRYICGSSTYDSYESVPSFSLQAGGNHTLRVECTQKKNGTSTTTVVGEVALVAGNNITLTDDKTSTPSTITIDAAPISLAWTRIAKTSGSSSAAIDLTGYSEIMIVANVLRNSARHIFTTAFPIVKPTTTPELNDTDATIYSTAMEYKLGGYVGANSSTSGGAWCSISLTAFAGVAVYINNSSFLSNTTWTVYAR